MVKKIIIEGNIGSGKTTFVNYISKNFKDATVNYEPVEKWQSYKDEQDINLLNNFYNDQQRWGYTFQNMAFMTRVKDLIKPCDTKYKFIERSIYTDRNCFALNCYETGKINKMEWEIYTDWFNWLSNSFDVKPDGYIYLRVKPDICLERINKRNRQEESGIPIEYLENIHIKHDDWLLNEKKIPILVLDWNCSFDNNIKDVIESFIKKL
jgi:deoxyadenosine/deoxycytidine kinase